MGEAAGDITTLEDLREEVAELRRDMLELRRTVVAGPGQPMRSREERLASLQRIRQLRGEILRRRGGQLLPSSAEEIARTREERSAQLLGESIQ